MRSRKSSPVVSGGFCLFAALAILLLPLKWLLACCIAALFHELCHLLALKLLGGKWQHIAIFASGARIPISDIGRGRELICTLAGPLGGLLLSALYPVLPILAFCALVQSLYNLLPIYPLDGGRALRCAADMLLPPLYAQWLCESVAWCCIGAIAATAFYATVFAGWGVWPLAAVFILLAPRFTGKISCKLTALAVQ